ncbi:triose-phosphate isomerase [Sneathiella glossodoripedis]|uniref:triose-phosphate isomerase n=1 Tax=Sneathiella glossodoripedis TaxID=418853 RepID=UPI00046E7A5E|nr:triose-phosphate isomerase [Sneathiella glossodoripedis]
MSVRPLIAGNWKMNGLRSESITQIEQLVKKSADAGTVGCDILICPPFTLVKELADLAQGSAVSIGAQDCHANVSGAHTGDISAEMLKDAGASYIIVGHSERRTDHHESSDAVKAKAEAVLQAGLVAIVCVGETLEQRENGETLSVVGEQIEKSLPAGASADNTVIAYEPVWAIGTGKTPTPADVAEVHAFIREKLGALTAGAEGVRLLYGGSVKASNADELMALENVDGALVGGASLKVDDFWPIVETGI